MRYKPELARPVIRAADCLGFLDAYSFLRGLLAGPKVTILMYHQVGGTKYPWSPTPLRQDFENQIRYLCQRYEVISLDKLVQYIQEEKYLPPKTAVVTLDDGYRDSYLVAYPILKKYNVPMTIFLATGYLDRGKLFWWDRVRYAVYNSSRETLELDELGRYSLRSAAARLQASSKIEKQLNKLAEDKKNVIIEKLVSMSGVDIPANLGKELVLSWDEVREMANNGIVFGAHTVTHPILTKLSLEEAKREIVQSKKRIEEETSQPVTTFCYPNGEPTDFNEDIKEILKESAFACAVTTISWRQVSIGTDVYELGRVGWSGDPRTLKFLTALYPDLQAVLRRIRST